MLAKNYTEIRNNFKTVCDSIIEDAETVIVTRKNDENIVMMSLVEYNNLMENMHIRNSKANYNHILESRKQLQDGNTVVKDPEDYE